MCEKIEEIPISQIRPFGGDYGKAYFHIRQSKVEELTQSIQQVGILEPLIVRPDTRGEAAYELIAGKTRITAAEKANLKTVPCIVRELDDYDAVCLYGESNRYRDNITITEKAFMLRYSDERAAQKYKTDLQDRNAIFSEAEDRQIRRYIRLTYLILSIRHMVDVRKISISAGCEISYLPSDVQEKIAYILNGQQIVITVEAVQKIRELYENGRRPFGKTITTKELYNLILDYQPSSYKKAHLAVNRSLIKNLPPEYQSKKASEKLVENLLKNFVKKF